MYLRQWTETTWFFSQFLNFVFIGRGKRHGVGVANFCCKFAQCDYFNLIKWNLFYCYQLYYFPSQLLLLFQFLININFGRNFLCNFFSKLNFKPIQ